MASEFALIHFSSLEEDPKNIRRIYTGIDELAYTINEYGLLQNLLVVPINKERFVVKDGNRRRRAIAHLIERNLWDKDKPVPCYILDSNGNIEQLVAEVQKSPAPIWHLGYRFIEFTQMDMTQEQMSVRVGKTRGFISRAIQIATNLDPEVINRLDKLPPNTLTNEQVFGISRLIHPVTLKPDKEAQLQKIESFLQVSKRIRPKGKAKNKDLTARFYKMKTKLKIPIHAIPYVNAIVGYLDGQTNVLKFKI